MAKPVFEKSPGLLRLVLVGGVSSIGLMLYSVYAGIALWKVAPHAVLMAKRYLALVFFFTIFNLILPALVGVPEGTHRKMFEASLMNSLRTMLYVAVWYLYLLRSRRVKATYGVVEKTMVIKEP